ncbi:hypothetical protein BKA65DRAFT_605393 [Rhexocercosporidium sp. MPI-PUGE-AT-0058]|nr:hypothetical protein BKA65DRAFT_605393 [Rhexocercosporidium sp. MPI-PUGE-AT-0058]
MPPPTLDVKIHSTTEIFPSPPLNKPITAALSILDNTSANFSRCAAIWYYPPSTSPLTLNDLTTSLSHALNSYRPWCGRLTYTSSPFTTHGPQSTRYQRIHTTYNTPHDIGIPLTIASSPHALSSFLPSLHTRKSTLKAWSASENLPSSSLLPNIRLSLSSPSASEDAPNIVIQLTTFACGSVSVGIAITHCLADALSLSRFANDWALTTRSLLKTTETRTEASTNTGSPLPDLSPVFEPQRLDAYAAGDINGPPDEEIQRKARELPHHRYDWYTPVEGQPWPNPKPGDFDDAVKASGVVGVGLSPSIPIPWEQWDTSLPVSHRVLHFSREQIIAIYKLANTTSTSTSSPPGESEAKISKHDALLAHLWSHIITSRDLPPGTTSYLDLTFGVRARLDPPLPDEFLGSPIMHVSIPFTSPSTSTPASPPRVEDVDVDLDVGEDTYVLSRKIRAYLGKFGSEEISHVLHDRASEIAPQRLWTTCLGREHLLLTTWVHSGIHNVEFIPGCRAVHVEAVMPPLDGLVEIMEAPGDKKTRDDGNWIDDGVDVSLFLEAVTMERLLGMQGLWGGVWVGKDMLKF